MMGGENKMSKDIESQKKTQVLKNVGFITFHSVWPTNRRMDLVKARQDKAKLRSFSKCHSHITATTTVLRPFFRDYPGEPVPEENFWTLWCKGRLTEADTPTIRLGATPSWLTSAHLHQPPIFYRPDALHATQPTVSKHWKHLAHSD